MQNNDSTGKAPLFYTVHEAAELFRVNPVTLYRAIRDDEFPAVRIRNRYIIPAKAVEQLIDQVSQSGSLTDFTDLLAQQRTARDLARRLDDGS